jgi:2,3-bisphosphoglycerate-independent phosphoglycerate mutase
MYEFNAKTGEVKRDANGQIAAKTSHTLNRVPLSIYAPGYSLALKPKLGGAGLGNIAATLLQLHGFESPEEYQASLLG